MRVGRVKAEGAGYYHIMSRVIEGRMALGEDEKEAFRKMMRAVSGFCGVEVLTYAILDNHFLCGAPHKKWLWMRTGS